MTVRTAASQEVVDNQWSNRLLWILCRHVTTVAGQAEGLLRLVTLTHLELEVEVLAVLEILRLYGLQLHKASSSVPIFGSSCLRSFGPIARVGSQELSDPTGILCLFGL